MEDEKRFIITDDKKADWALNVIKEASDERDRLINLANEKINDLREQIDAINKSFESDTAYLKSCLFEYFNTVPHKESKTQSSYKLLTGSLVLKKSSLKIVHDDDKLIEALDGTEYVETKKSLKWGEYKKNLTITDDCTVVDTSTGEVIEACAVEETPASFDVKF